MIDAGANLGIFTMVAAMRTGLEGCVYAIEPHIQRRLYTLLQYITDNQATHVKAFSCALGDRDGTVGFSDNPCDNDLNHVLRGEHGITVPVRRLNDLWIDEPIDLPKIDVEGYELNVLQGAVELLSRVRCIVFEVEEEKCERYSYSAVDLLNLVRSHEFRIFRIIDNRAAEAPQAFIPNQSEDLVPVRDPNDFFERTGYRPEGALVNILSLRMHRLNE